MTSRLLMLPDEAARLQGTALEHVWPQLQADRANVAIVEDGLGVVRGTWAFYLLLHAHGGWIDPAYRKGAVVARHLLRALTEQADAIGATRIETGAEDPALAALLKRHLQAVPVPGETLMIPRSAVCR